MHFFFSSELGISLIQFETKDTLSDTLKHLSEMVEKTVAQYKPRVICLPEGFNYHYQSDKKIFWAAGEQPINGTTSQHMSMLAKKFNVYLMGGIAELDNDKLYNTALVFNPMGEMIARHRKVPINIHLFLYTNIVSFLYKHFFI